MFDFKNFIFDLIFPIECLGCQEDGEWVCQKCFSAIKINFSNDCKLQQKKYLDQVLICADYSQDLLRQLLHVYKYNFVVDSAKYLTALLIDFINFQFSQGKIPNFDLVVPVPLSKKRKLWRGFNQSEIIAKNISNNFDWCLEPNLIFRKQNSRPQVGLDLEKRLQNVQGIFKLKNNQLLEDKIILLVDDVVTTGATMDECAKALKAGGAYQVWGLVVAKN